MRDLTAGHDRVTVSGRTIGEIIDALEVRHPGIRARLCEGDQLNPAIAVTVEGKVAQLGLREPVKEQSEIHFLPAVAGG